MALTSANITNLNELLNYFAGPIKLQYTGARAIKDGNSDNTFYTDNAHDDVNLDAGSANEDAIFSNTRLVPAETHCEFMNREYKTPANVNGKFTQLEAIDITGNKHYGHNKLYVLDVFLHSWLLGPNNLLDSAKTPNVNKFYKEYGITDFNKPLYKSVSTIPSLAVADRFLYSGFQNFDMLNHLFITFITEPEAIAASTAAATATATALAAGAGEAAAEAAGEAAATASAVASVAAGGGPQSWWLTYMTDTYYITHYSAMLLKNINFLWQMTLTYCHHAVTEITTIATRNYYLVAIFLLRHINFTEITSNNVLRFKCGYNAPRTPIENFVVDLVASIDTNLGVPMPRQNIPVTPVMDWDAEQPTCGQAILSTLNTPAAPGSHPKIDPRGDNPSVDPVQLAAINGIAAAYYGALDVRNIQMRMWSLLKFTGDTSHIVFAIIIQCAWDSFAKRKNFIIPSKAVAYREASNLNVFMLTGERPMMSRFINHNFSFMAKDTFVAVVDCTNQTPVLNRRKVFYYSTSIIAVAEQKVDEYTRKYNTPLELSSPEADVDALYNGQKALYDAFKASLRNPTDAVFNIDSDAKATAALTILSGQEYEYFYKCFDFLYAFSVLHNIDKDAIKLRCIELRKILFGIYHAKNGAFKPTQSILRNVDDSDFIDIDDISRQLNYIIYLFLIRDGPAITVPATPQATAISLIDWYDELEPSITNKIELIFVTLSIVLLAQCRNKSEMAAGSVKYSVEDAGILTIIGSTCASQLQLFKGVVAPSTTDLMKVLEFTFSGISKTQSHKIDIINIFIYNLFTLCSLCPSNLVYTILRSTDKNAIKGSFDGDKFSLKIPIHAYNALYKEKNLTISCKQITKQIYIGGEISKECLDVIRLKIERLVETRNNYIYQIGKNHELVFEMYPMIIHIDKLILALNILLIFIKEPPRLFEEEDENPTLSLNCTLERGWARIRYETLVGRKLIGCIEEWISATIKNFLDENAVLFTELERRGQTMKPNTLVASRKYIDLLVHYNEVNINYQITLDAYNAIIIVDNEKLPRYVVEAKVISCEIIGQTFSIHWMMTDDIKIVVDWYIKRKSLSNSQHVLKAFIFLNHCGMYNDSIITPISEGMLSKLQDLSQYIIKFRFDTSGDPNQDWDALSRITLEQFEFSRIDLIEEMMIIYEEYMKNLSRESILQLRELPNYKEYIDEVDVNSIDDVILWYDDILSARSFFYTSVGGFKQKLIAPFVNIRWSTEAIEVYAMVQTWKKYNKYFNSQAVFDAYKVLAPLLGAPLRPIISNLSDSINVPGATGRVISESFDSKNLPENIKQAINVSLNETLIPPHMREAISASFNITSLPPTILQAINESLEGANIQAIITQAFETSFIETLLPVNITQAIETLIDKTIFLENLKNAIIASLFDINLTDYIKEAIVASFNEKVLTANIKKWSFLSISEENLLVNLTRYIQYGIIESFNLENIPVNIAQSVVASFSRLNFAAYIPQAMFVSTKWNQIEEIDLIVDWYRRYSDNMENISKIVVIHNQHNGIVSDGVIREININIATQIAIRVDEVDELMRVSYVENNTPPPNLELAYTFATELYKNLPLQIQQAYENSYRPNCTGRINWAKLDAVNVVMNWYNNSYQERIPTAYREAVRLHANLSPEIQEAIRVSYDGTTINLARTDANKVVLNWYNKYLFYSQNGNVSVAYREAARLHANLSLAVQEAIRVSYDGTKIIFPRTDAIDAVMNWYDKYIMYSQNKEVLEAYQKLQPLYAKLPPEVQQAITVSYDGANINWARTDAIEEVLNWYDNYKLFDDAYREAVRLRENLPIAVQEAIAASYDGTNINLAITDANKVVLNWYNKYSLYSSKKEMVNEVFLEFKPLFEYFPIHITHIIADSVYPRGHPNQGEIKFENPDAIEAVMIFYSSGIELYKKIHRAILTLKEYMKMGTLSVMNEQVRQICYNIETTKVIDYTSDTLTALMDWYNSDFYRFVVVTEFNKTLIRINGYRPGQDDPSFERVIQAFRSVTRDNPTVNIETIDWRQVDNINIVLNWNSRNIGPILFGGHRKKNSGSKKSKKMKIVKSKKNKLIKKGKTIKKRKILKKIKKSKKINLIKKKTVKRK